MDQGQVQELVELASTAGLLKRERRHLLLAGLPAAFVAGMQTHDNAADQVRADLLNLGGLNELNGVSGEPIAVWLSNAAALAWYRPEGARFVQLARVYGATIRMPSAEVRLLDAAGSRAKWILLALSIALVAAGFGAGVALVQPEKAMISTESTDEDSGVEVTTADAGVEVTKALHALASIRRAASEARGQLERVRSARAMSERKRVDDALAELNRQVRRILELTDFPGSR